MNVLEKARLTLNLAKCLFNIRECTYLGFEVVEVQVRLGKMKFEASEKFPRSKK